MNSLNKSAHVTLNAMFPKAMLGQFLLKIQIGIANVANVSSAQARITFTSGPHAGNVIGGFIADFENDYLEHLWAPGNLRKTPSMTHQKTLKTNVGPNTTQDHLVWHSTKNV